LTYDQFCLDRRTVDAVVRNFEVIGEAARHIPPRVEARHLQVPWHQMRTMRNELIHNYPGVDTAIVWDAVQTDLPPLVTLLAVLEDEVDAG
jgi:uncharacterized protein with HEPN domain